MTDQRSSRPRMNRIQPIPSRYAWPQRIVPTTGHDLSAPSRRSERVRAALDRNRASGNGPRGLFADERQPGASAMSQQDDHWTDGTAAIDAAQAASARKMPDGQSTTAPTTPFGETQRRATPDSPMATTAGGQSMFIPPPRLNARYTFKTFIVGSANQLAHAASQAVAERQGRPTIHSFSMVAWGWARHTCSMRLGMWPSSGICLSLCLVGNIHERNRQRYSLPHHRGVPRQIPFGGFAAGGRHPVHRGQRLDRRGILPHVQQSL